MDETNQPQKDVGQKYRDNLGYFKTPGFLHREKFFLSILAVIIGVYGIIRLELSRSDKVYNPAPLSVSHANLEGNCVACHTLAARNIFHPMQSTGSEDTSPALPVAFSSSLAINESCQKCHQGMDLHQPTGETMQLRAFHTELHVVAATGCFNCHQEHLGRIDMRLPGDSACAACHDDATKMAASFR